MGATPDTKCVTILAVFNADCFTILPDFCRFIFPTLLTFTSAWQTVFPRSRAHGLKSASTGTETSETYCIQLR